MTKYVEDKTKISNIKHGFISTGFCDRQETHRVPLPALFLGIQVGLLKIIVSKLDHSLDVGVKSVYDSRTT